MPAPAAAAPWPMPPLVGASIALHGTAALAAVLAPQSAGWALGAVAANHAVITAAGLWPRSRSLGPNVDRLDDAAAARNEVALTFDDGPDAEITPRVLDVLDAFDVRASFFCIGKRAARHVALVREIVRRGHDVQNHSLTHRLDFSLLGPRGMAREVLDGQSLLADLTGTAPHCFRAPAGLRNPFLDPVLHRAGLQLASWTRRGYDTRDGNAARVLARLVRGLRGGDVLLLHDGHVARTRTGAPVVLDVLPAVLERCRAAGLRGVTLRAGVPTRHAALALAA